MVPVTLDPSRLRLGLAARGPAGNRRLALLRHGGAADLVVFSDDPDIPATHRRLPDMAELALLDMLWVAGLPRSDAEPLAQRARSQRVRVNVEDIPELCDFHNVAEIRRGDLLLTVSTGGRSPGLAAAVRAALDRQFGSEWAERADLAARRRQQWRAQGHDMQAVRERTDELAQAGGWFR